MSLLSNIRIGTRLTICFAIILLFLIVISAVSITRLNQLAETSRQFVDVDVKQVVLASEIDAQAQAAALKLLQILSTTERDERIPLYKDMDAKNATLSKLIAMLQASNEQSSNAEQLSLQSIVEHRKAYEIAFIETVEFVEFDRSLAFEHYNENTRHKLNDLLAAISNLLVKQQSMMHSTQQLAEEENKQATSIVITLSVIALLSVFILAILVSRSIVLPLLETVKLANQIAKGNIQQPESMNRKDEIGKLGDAFIAMCAGLNELISSIRSSAEHINSSADSLISPVNSVKQGSDDQRLAVGKIEEIVSTFTANTTTAANAVSESKQQAETAMKLATEGKYLIDQTTDEFDKISNTISNSVQVVESLRDHAASVTNLVSTVREIAEQTNLLALNAAIEAARAGESGRGLSVVADEVRSLAVRASKATSEIDKVIESIVNGTKTAADRIGEGRNEMEDGVNLLQKMVQPLSELNTSAKLSLTQLTDLESTVEKQLQQSNEITSEVTKIAIMAEENTHSVNNVSTITNSLNDHSSSLKLQITKFS